MKKLAKKLSLITAILMVFQLASFGLGVGTQGALAAAPTNQDTVFPADVIKKSGDSVTINSSGDATNEIWFAPDGTSVFSAGSTMTQAADGAATTILAPATAGDYKLYLINSTDEVSAPSVATLTVDNTKPIITPNPLYNGNYITSDPDNGDVINIPILFDKEMNTTVNPKIYVSGGEELSSSIYRDSYSCVGSWQLDEKTFIFDCTQHDVNVNLPATKLTFQDAQDYLGNIQEPYTTSGTVAVDTLNPTVTFTANKTNPTNESPITITANFSEDVTGLDVSDFVSPSGNITDLTGSGKAYTFTLTPTTNGEIKITLPANSVEDLNQNKNTEGTFSINYDSIAPSGVTGLKVIINSLGQPVVTWTNPPAGTYSGLKILRDSAFLATLDPSATSYTDSFVAQGVTYSYEVVSYDKAGNETGTTPVYVKVPMPPRALLASAGFSDSGDETAISQATTTTPSNTVKANENKTDDNKNKDDKNDLPLWGIVVLFILAIIGGYLVYTQRPRPVTRPTTPISPKSKAPRSTRKK